MRVLGSGRRGVVVAGLRMRTHPTVLLSLAVLVVFTGLSSISHGTEPSPRPRLLSRERLIGVLDEVQAESQAKLNGGPEVDPAISGQISVLLRNYRSSSQPLPPGTVKLTEAPYLGLVLGERLGDLYPAAYETTYQMKYDQIVVHADLEYIFDQFLNAYLKGELPPQLNKTADKLGECLAEKALRGAGRSCKLDKSDTVYGSRTGQLLRIKLGCNFRHRGSCATRQIIYNEAKGALIRARNDRALEGPFKASFPKLFRDGFMNELAAQRKTFPVLVSQKFGGNLEEVMEEGVTSIEKVEETFWSDNTPLVEDAHADGADTVSLRGFAMGLRADLGAAEWLAQSANPSDRVNAAALFYAAANRLLMLTGGKEASWDGQRFVIDLNAPGAYFDPKNPKAAPTFLKIPYGGWGLQVATGARAGAQFSPWDWAAYDPLNEKAPSPLRLLPAWFRPGAHGVPAPLTGTFAAEERLEDLAELVSALSRFLVATRPGSVFASHFGPADKAGDILDPKSPMVFPLEGRKLAIGVAAGVLRNMVLPKFGHIDQTEAGTPQGGLGLRFYDVIGLGGRVDQPASVSSVSRLLFGAAELREALATDPDSPPELQALLPQVDQALQAGALSIGAQGQNPDGGFADTLVLPQAPAVATSPRSLATAIDGLRVLTRAYDASHILLLRLNLQLGWQSLARYWNAAANGAPALEAQIPFAIEGQPSSKASARALWEVLRLWDETRKAARPDLDAASAGIDWTVWDSRMARLRAFLSN
jgi:hypothetical protein